VARRHCRSIRGHLLVEAAFTDFLLGAARKPNATARRLAHKMFSSFEKVTSIIVKSLDSLKLQAVLMFSKLEDECPLVVFLAARSARMGSRHKTQQAIMRTCLAEICLAWVVKGISFIDIHSMFGGDRLVHDQIMNLFMSCGILYSHFTPIKIEEQRLMIHICERGKDFFAYYCLSLFMAFK